MIADRLGASPQRSRLMGFDLLVYHDCIEFAMEYCVPVTHFTC